MSIKTTSLETSKLLKDAGLKQEIKPGDWYWVILSNSREKLFFQNEGEDNVSTTPYPWFKSFTTDELLEELPSSIKYNGEYGMLLISKRFKFFDVYYCNLKGLFIPKEPFTSEILPEALAQMWLYLKKEGLLNAKS